MVNVEQILEDLRKGAKSLNPGAVDGFVKRLEGLRDRGCNHYFDDLSKAPSRVILGKAEGNFDNSQVYIDFGYGGKSGGQTIRLIYWTKNFAPGNNRDPLSYGFVTEGGDLKGFWLRDNMTERERLFLVSRGG